MGKAILLAGLLATAAGVHAAEPAPGDYATRPGWGSLSIRDGDGKRTFELSAIGANGHVCNLSGTLQGSAATLEDVGSGRCELRFAVHGDVLEVSGSDGCRGYCGARAGFEGEYARLPAGCSAPERTRRGDRFLADYRGRRYAAALATLDATRGECGAFFDWLDRDQHANDRAITLLHLGRPAECLAALDTTLAGASRDEESLQQALEAQGGHLPPTGWDAYLPIARATWFNRRQCEAALRTRR